MKYIWLCRAPKEEKAELIVFCNGWGMDGRVVRHLDGTGCHVVCLYDWRSPNLPERLAEEVAMLTLSRRTVIAWSLGVFMSEFVRRSLPPFDTALACNGTPWPVEARRGIDPAVYAAMTRDFRSDAARDAFMDQAGMDRKLCRQDVACLREELDVIGALALQNAATPRLPFHAALVSSGDRIFAARNQLRAWKDCPETRIVKRKGGHWPFGAFSSWKELSRVHV